MSKMDDGYLNNAIAMVQRHHLLGIHTRCEYLPALMGEKMSREHKKIVNPFRGVTLLSVEEAKRLRDTLSEKIDQATRVGRILDKAVRGRKPPTKKQQPTLRRRRK